MSMKIWVDADSVPVQYRQIILKRATKENIATIFVADRTLNDVLIARDNHSALLRDPYRQSMERDELRKIKSAIEMVVVTTGANSADDYIIDNISEDDLLITHDIPLASRAVSLYALVLDDRGNTYTEENIKARLSERNMMNELRCLGLFVEKQGAMGEKTKTEFSNAFDRALVKLKK